MVLDWGLAGAALATALGQAMGAIVPLIYFFRPNDSLLRLTKTTFHKWILTNTCINGSSEMVSNLSSSLINILYNFQLMRIAGQDGVAAYGIVMYTNFIFLAVFIGYSIGSAPIVSYHYGAGTHKELKNLFQKSLVLTCVSGIIMTFIAEISAAPLVRIFAGYDPQLFAMTCRGFKLYSLSFLMMGVNVWGSGFFTALNNGTISAAISFLRTFLFQVSMVLLLPTFLGIDGIWLAIVAAELLAFGITAVFLIVMRKRYHYA